MNIEIAPPTESGERRSSARHSMQQPCRIRERGRSAIGATLLDLAERGCLIESFCVPVGGNQVWVRMQGLESLSGMVIWTNGQRAGVAFDVPLHPAVALRQSAGGAGPPEMAGEVAGGAEPIEIDPMLSRREQISHGMVSDTRSPLSSRKLPKGTGMDAMISRFTRRNADQRGEERFAEVVEGNTAGLSIDGNAARLVDISESGLRAEVRFDPLEGIGRQVGIVFSQAPEIEGRIVWRSDSEAGFELPGGSFDLKSN